VIGCAVFGVFDGLIRVDFSRGMPPSVSARTAAAESIRVDQG